MSETLERLIEKSIADELDRINVMSDQELLESLIPWLDQEAAQGLFAGTPQERFHEWLQSNVIPHLRNLGVLGQQAWDAICDPSSRFSKDRIACVVLSLAVLTGLQQADISTLVSIATLAIRSKHPKP